MNISILDYVYATVTFNTRIITHINKLRRFTYNWYELIPFVIFKRDVTFRLRNGKTKTVRTYKDYYDLIHHSINESVKGVKYYNNRVMARYKGKRVFLYFEDTGTKNKAQLLLKQNFIGENVKLFDVKGKTIIDIGSAIADTPILFALNGARHIYGYEPDRQLHRLAMRNVKANNLGRRITLINKPAVSLDRLARHKGDVLKIDCEGCEYNLIMNASESALSKYSEILLEYHYGYKDLIGKLRDSGFRVSRTVPIRSYNLEEGRTLWLGSIYATKRYAKPIRFQ